jgi:hypothetical protein
VPTRSQVATETITFNATPGDVMTNAEPEAAQAGMDAWMAWSQRAGSAIVDLGSPLQAVSSDVEGDPVGRLLDHGGGLPRSASGPLGQPLSHRVGRHNRDSRVPLDGRRQGSWLRC